MIEAEGYILLVSSGSGLVHGSFQAAYNASKAGMHALGNTLRSELRGRGVAVGVAYFNATDTPKAHAAMNHPMMAPRPVDEAATGLSRGIARQSRAVFVPGSARLAAVAPGLHQQDTDRWVARRLRDRPRSGAATP